MLVDLLPRVRAKDLIVADRNFCTTRFVFGVAVPQGFFLVREHASNVPWEAVSTLEKCGTTASGDIYEQTVRVTNSETKATMDLRPFSFRAVNMYAASLDWTGWRQLAPGSLMHLLTAIAHNVHMALLTRSKRGPKKPPAEEPTYDKKHKHFATARILDNSC